MSPRPRVLLVDDEEYVRDSLVEIVAGEGFEPVAAANLAQAREALASASFHAVLTDLRMPGGGGLALLEEVRRGAAPIPVIVITGHGTVGEAVDAMKAGAYDFIQKPADPDQLLLVLRRALEHQRLTSEVRWLRGAVDGGRDRTLAGSSPEMARVRGLIEQVAPTDATVLVTGESGTGKELVAAEIHRRSARAERPLVRVNCAAVPQTLFESEFFGHRRGAFSGAIGDRTGRFAEAEGGTLVLDEIGTLHPEVQAKLLRVLECGEYQVVGESRTRLADVRVVAITNEDLEARVASGQFRADLYYRLAIFPIRLPALREHKGDIPEIAEQLLGRIRRGAWARAADGDGTPLEPGALAVLESYDWPGNVRELRNVLERALIVAGPRPADAGLFRGILESALPAAEGGSRDLDLRARRDELERELVRRALERATGKRGEAARMLGIDPKNLGYYLRKHGLGEGGAREAGPR